MRVTLFSLTLFAILGAVMVYADDSYMGSRGGSIFPSKTDDIQMLWEVVHVKAEKESCLVNCTFQFYNFGPSDTCTVGFPNHFYYAGGESSPFRNFRCGINGENIAVTSKTEISDSGKDYESGDFWYIWQMDFPQRESVQVVNSYTASWGGSIEGSKRFEYKLGTARSWRAPIGNGKIVIDHSAVAGGRFVSLLEKNVGWIVKKYDDSLIVEFENHTPREFEEVVIDMLSFWDDPYDNDQRVGRRSLQEYADALRDYVFNFGQTDRTKDDLQEMINEIYARHGYIFKNRKLAAKYEGRGWYRPDPTFREEKMNKYAKAMVNVIQELLDRTQ